MKPSAYQAYRAALALNNMAVEMIKRGQVHDSLKTLSDALCLFKAIFHPSASHDEDGMRDEIASEKLQSARQRQRTSGHKEKINDPGLMGIEVSPIDDEDIMELRLAALYGPSGSVVFPVLVRSFDHSDRSVVERKFGSVMYNHGLAHWLVARQSTEQQRLLVRKGERNKRRCWRTLREKSLERASRTFALSHKAHVRILQEKPLLMEQDDDSSTSSIQSLSDDRVASVLLSALCLNLYSQVLRLQGQTKQAEDALLEVSLLRSTVLDSDLFLDLFEGALAVAAAA